VSGERIVGRAVDRRDAWDKVTGRTRFIADVPRPGAWYGAALRSPVARGRLRGLARDPGFDWSAVSVIAAADLPGPNVVSMVRDDLPLLADPDIDFASQALALVAAPDRGTLAAALAALTPDIEELPPVLTVEAALDCEAIIWGEDNLIADYLIECGDLAAGFAEADRVVEGTYRTGYQEHIYLETQGVIATPSDDGGVEILGSMQCPFYVLNALAKALDLDRDRIAVRQAPTGGAFGGKEDYPSVLALQAAVLALRCGHPVAMIYDRHEDILATTKRHPSLVRHRTGLRADGTIAAADIDVIIDAGAFATMSPVVLSRSILHAAGAYRVPHARIRGRAVATNTPPNGAFRGFGVPQSVFAAERHMDRLAREAGLTPVEVRRRNLLRPGDRFPFGQELGEGDVAAELVYERALASGRYAARRDRARDFNTVAGGGGSPLRRGVGSALVFHGGGFTGDGEERISAEVKVRRETDGAVTILVGSVEMGQGAETVLPMIAAEALGLPLEKVRYHQPDTSAVADSGPTVASRTTMVVGRILAQACRELVVAEADGATAPCEAIARYEPDPAMAWDQSRHHGDAYQGYAWGAAVVEVEVDTDTLEIRPVHCTAVVEIGRAVNPVLCVGQVEGGVLQGLAWGSLEEVKTEGGRYLNDRMSTYIIPTCLDAPDFKVELVEQPCARGAYGAKGLGELPMNMGAPALVAAVEDALGFAADEIPLTPERLLDNRPEVTP
jgi:CO/xanthine dehydrogenase Mo-binding subunit